LAARTTWCLLQQHGPSRGFNLTANQPYAALFQQQNALQPAHEIVVFQVVSGLAEHAHGAPDNCNTYLERLTMRAGPNALAPAQDLHMCTQTSIIWYQTAVAAGLLVAESIMQFMMPRQSQ